MTVLSIPEAKPITISSTEGGSVWVNGDEVTPIGASPLLLDREELENLMTLEDYFNFKGERTKERLLEHLDSVGRFREMRFEAAFKTIEKKLATSRAAERFAARFAKAIAKHCFLEQESPFEEEITLTIRESGSSIVVERGEDFVCCCYGAPKQTFYPSVVRAVQSFLSL